MFFKIIKIFYILLLLFIQISCFDSFEQNTTIIRAGKSIVTIDEFNNAFEISKTAYPPENLKDPIIYKKARLHLLEQMAEEIIIVERARELDIQISDQELEAEIQEIKADYPDNFFEQTFVDQAISYDIWKKRLKNRLLIEKTTDIELEKDIEVSNEDIEFFYQKYKNHDIEPDPEHPLKPTDNNNTNEPDLNKIKGFIKKEKAQKLYKNWIKDLKQKYGLYINVKLI